MNFILRVLGDGLGSPSVSSFKQISDESLKDWQGYTARDLHPCPVEFTVSPAAGSVRSVSDVDIKVQFINTIPATDEIFQQSVFSCYEIVEKNLKYFIFIYM